MTPTRIKLTEIDLDSAGTWRGMVVIVERAPDPTTSLFDRESTAGPGRDWAARAELRRMKRELRREERQRRAGNGTADK